MFAQIARASLIAAALAFAGLPLAAIAQTAAPATPKVEAPAQPKAPKVAKSSPGKSCAQHQANSQAHKDCIAKAVDAKKAQGKKKKEASKGKDAKKS